MISVVFVKNAFTRVMGALDRDWGSSQRRPRLHINLNDQKAIWTDLGEEISKQKETQIERL